MADKILLEFPGQVDSEAKIIRGFYYKAICQLLILIGLTSCLWSVNNVFITVPASHLSGFYQTLGIGFSFVGCFIIEKVVQGTKYTRGQVMCVGMAIAVFVMLALAETGTDISVTTLIWWICFLLNQLAANYAQVLLEFLETKRR